MGTIDAWAAASEPYGSGRKAAIGALLDQDLLARLARYKRQVAKRYRVVEPETIERQLPAEQLFCSPKLDGELWFLIKAKGDVALVAYNGRVLHGVSLLEAPKPGAKSVAERLAGVDQIVIAGELIATPPNERPRSHHVGTALGDPKLEPTLAFSGFDLVEENGEDVLGRPYEERHARILELLGQDAGSRCSVVLTERGEPSLVANRYREWVGSDRFEGVVARSDRGLTYKIKPTQTIDMVVIAFGERVTGETHQVRELQVGLLREDGTFQLVGSVGTGLSEDDRSRWHAKLSAIETKSSFRLANREGTLCRFVRPEIVVEIRVSDLLSTDSWDAPMRRMSLSYDAATGWRPIAETKTAVLLHPTLLRERTDKKVDLGSVGLTQITPYLEGATEETVRTARRASAEVKKRGVFRKETKGQVAVRKYVVIRTHKEHEGTHAPFVAFFTDYSAGRKEPLQTSLRTAATAEEADEHVALWLEENVKRGWEPVTGEAPAPMSAPEPVEAAPEAAAPAKKKAAKKTTEKKTTEKKTIDKNTTESTGEEPAPKKRRAAKKE